MYRVTPPVALSPGELFVLKKEEEIHYRAVDSDHNAHQSASAVKKIARMTREERRNALDDPPPPLNYDRRPR